MPQAIAESCRACSSITDLRGKTGEKGQADCKLPGKFKGRQIGLFCVCAPVPLELNTLLPSGKHLVQPPIYHSRARQLQVLVFACSPTLGWPCQHKALQTDPDALQNSFVFHPGCRQILKMQSKKLQNTSSLGSFVIVSGAYRLRIGSNKEN